MERQTPRCWPSTVAEAMTAAAAHRASATLPQAERAGRRRRRRRRAVRLPDRPARHAACWHQPPKQIHFLCNLQLISPLNWHNDCRIYNPAPPPIHLRIEFGSLSLPEVLSDSITGKPSGPGNTAAPPSVARFECGKHIVCATAVRSATRRST